jgi:hypothetical protein
MKIRSGLFIFACLSGFAAAARAVAPSVQSLQANSVVVGENTTLLANVTDPDGDLVVVKFYVAGPGISGQQLVGSVNVSGSQAAPQINWSPAAVGVFTARAEAYDMSSMGALEKTFEGFAGRLTVAPLTLGSGVDKMFLGNGEIVTTENLTGPSVVAQSGANLILWAGGRVVLKPGFRAESGAFFWAAVDHNLNGYSDLEEITDTDGDGMPDAWEVDHGLNMLIAADASLDNDGDGATNLAEYQSGRDPNNRADGGQMPSGYQLVLRTPASQYYGVKTATWEIAPVAAP